MISMRWAAVLLVLAIGARAGESAATMSFIENGSIKLGVDLSRGGSIGHLEDLAKKSGNVVNVKDLGRWIGQSYYAGPRPFQDGKFLGDPWPWNPVSAGDIDGHPCKLLEHSNDSKTLYVKSQPMQWALKNVLAECTFETWITLDGRTARVRNRLVNQRADTAQYVAMDQELPAIYTIAPLHRLMTYAGDAPFTGGALAEIPKRPWKDGPKWTPFTAREHWAALVDENDWGLGVHHAGVFQFLGGFYREPGKGGPADDPCGYVAPIRKEILDHNIVYEYEYTLILDTLSAIRAFAVERAPKSALPDFRFTNGREHWTFTNAEDGCFPIQGALRLKLEKPDPQMYSPETFFGAKDAPALHIRAVFKTTQTTAELFWSTLDAPGFGQERRVAFPITADGAVHTYTIDLATHPAYKGMITGLRFDPVGSGSVGEWATVEFISFKKE